jgi:hypothetical protein
MTSAFLIHSPLTVISPDHQAGADEVTKPFLLAEFLFMFSPPQVPVAGYSGR